MKDSVVATVILPTTGDRKPALEYSIESVLNQSIKDFELFVIGDGVDGETHRYLDAMAQDEFRVSYHSFPKHERRGEEYRHQLLQQAKGEIVCYLCDRDLFLPNHIEHHYDLLQNSDLAVSMGLDIGSDKSVQFLQRKFFGVVDSSSKAVKDGAFQLSATSHTLAAYHRLPYGWRTTPQNQQTDRYMWKQFISRPDTEIVSSTQPTFLYFKRGNHPGLSTEKRASELQYWRQSALFENWNSDSIFSQAMSSELKSNTRFRQNIRSSPILFFGNTLASIADFQWKRIKKLFEKANR